MSLRILQICSARDFGGGERHVVDLCRALSQRGHEVHLAHRPGAAIVAHVADVPAVRLHALALRGAVDVLSAHKLARLAHEKGANIVHAHLARDYTLAKLAAHWTPKARLVLTRHVMFPLKALHRLTLGRADAVLAVSAAVQRQLLAQNLAAPNKISVIHNGLDTAHFAPQDRATARAVWRARLGWDANDDNAARLWVGFLGTLGLLKGARDLLDAAALVAQKCPDVAFLIAGPGRESERTTLLQVIESQGLANQIKLIGPVAETASFYAALDIFVSASHSEAFGLTLTEAMACGIPVIATSTDGAREIVRHGVTGRLVPIAQPEYLASSLLELLNDADTRQIYARQARADALNRFSLTQMVDRTENLYQQITETKRARETR